MLHVRILSSLKKKEERNETGKFLKSKIDLQHQQSPLIGSSSSLSSIPAWDKEYTALGAQHGCQSVPSQLPFAYILGYL